jgi:NTP pyrophosphatase (non-canonical NTP hydrolase)
MDKKELTLSEYQEKAMSTCMPTCDNFSYMFLNLVGEVGELASKVAKQIRKGNVTIGGVWYVKDSNGTTKTSLKPNKLKTDFLTLPSERDFEKELKAEAGDILWQLAGLCYVMGWDLNSVGDDNLAKLKARKAIGTIDGNGDGIERSK